jgi:general L-amino acid transport system permease protein
MKRPTSEEGYELTLGQPDVPAVEVAPEPEPATPAEWVRRNLFSSASNGVLTVVAAVFAVWLVIKVIGFVTGADWLIVKTYLRVFMVGRFPLEEIWRVWLDVYIVILLAGLSVGVMPPRAWNVRRAIRWAALVGGAAFVLLYLIEGVRIFLLLGGAVALLRAAVWVGRRVGRQRLRRPLIVAWVLAFPLLVVVLRGFDGVQPQYWGGFLLNAIAGVVAIFASFPIGLLLALGRRSTLPLVRIFSVGFIEFIRGVPLAVLLVFGVFAFELLLPPGTRFPKIVLAMIMMVVFSSAYVAEIVRGGLQGVPEGQYEAARALGLRYPRTMALVAIPQALRNTIPAMISHFISLWKDTSLLAVPAIFSDLLSIAGRASSVRDVRFIGHEAEALTAAAFLFWVVAFSMSRWSQRVETRVGVGER